MKPILNLTIKRNWLAMIASGFKKEEYRAPNCAQLRNWEKKRMAFFYRWEALGKPAIYRAGYAMDSMACVVEVIGVAPPEVCHKGHGVFSIEDPNFWKEPRHPEWGEPSLPHFTILLGEVLKTGSYEECKRFVEEMK